MGAVRPWNLTGIAEMTKKTWGEMNPFERRDRMEIPGLIAIGALFAAACIGMGIHATMEEQQKQKLSVPCSGQIAIVRTPVR